MKKALISAGCLATTSEVEGRAEITTWPQVQGLRVGLLPTVREAVAPEQHPTARYVPTAGEAWAASNPTP